MRQSRQEGSERQIRSTRLWSIFRYRVLRLHAIPKLHGLRAEAEWPRCTCSFAPPAAADIVRKIWAVQQGIKMPGTLLFTPLAIRDVKMRNRIVVPPMHQYSAVKGFPTDWHLMNAGKFAAGGAGLVVVESTKVERRGCGTVGDLGIWDDKFIEPLRRLVTFIKEQNAVAGIQLGHSGRKARANRPWEGDGPLKRTSEIEDWEAWTPVAPSAIAHSEKWPVPRALDRQEVKDLVQAWGHGARRAHEAGFD